MAAKSISDLRKELGAYLTKPMEVGTGSMSTQQVVNATSLSTGGLSGSFIIKDQGNIVIYDDSGNKSHFIGIE
jgi:hypothetical protein